MIHFRQSLSFALSERRYDLGRAYHLRWSERRYDLGSAYLLRWSERRYDFGRLSFPLVEREKGRPVSRVVVHMIKCRDQHVDYLN